MLDDGALAFEAKDQPVISATSGFEYFAVIYFNQSRNGRTSFVFLPWIVFGVFYLAYCGNDLDN
jgi:hypothetical protein